MTAAIGFAPYFVRGNGALTGLANKKCRELCSALRQDQPGRQPSAAACEPLPVPSASSDTFTPVLSLSVSHETSLDWRVASVHLGGAPIATSNSDLASKKFKSARNRFA
jgi:hypothetical protein